MERKMWRMADETDWSETNGWSERRSLKGERALWVWCYGEREKWEDDKAKLG